MAIAMILPRLMAAVLPTGLSAPLAEPVPAGCAVSLDGAVAFSCGTPETTQGIALGCQCT